MPGLYLEDITELAAAPAAGDWAYVVDVSPLPEVGRRITIDNLVRQYLESQNAIEFTQATTINTTTGNLILGAAGDVRIAPNTRIQLGTETTLTGNLAPSPTLDEVLFNSVDIAGGDRRLVIASEAGDLIYLGNDRLRFAAATGIIGIGATTVLSLTTAGLALAALNLTMTGTIAATGARVTNIFTTNQTTTNAETVDSWGETKKNIKGYKDALAVVRNIQVVSYEHKLAFDPTDRRKLGVLAESIREPLVTPGAEYTGLGVGPRLDMLGLAALNTRAIQQLAYEQESHLSAIEERLGTVEEANRILRGQLEVVGIIPGG